MPLGHATAHAREQLCREPALVQLRLSGDNVPFHSTAALADSMLTMPSCVLAYSGGLDTSVILGWLQDEGYDVHAVYVDLGQPCEDREAILEKARACGAKSARIVDAREELCRDFAFPVLQWQAKYEGIYLLGTSIARPLISKVCLQVAREVGADAYAHGATGKGNDQCRFQLAAEALDPGVKMIAPWRIEKFRKLFPGRTRDDRLLRAEEDSGQGVARQALQLRRELPAHQLRSRQARRPDGQRRRAGRLRHDRLAASRRPTRSRRSRSASSRACRRRSTARSCRPLEIVTELNKIGGRNGVGRIDIVENRFVGMKSRGVYEAPGMTMLYAAHLVIEQLTLDRDLTHLRDRLAPEVAEMVYYGFWYAAKMDALMAFIREAQKPVTGEVTLEALQGQHHRRQPHEPEQPVRRGDRQHGRGRQLQPDRRRRLPAHPGPADPRAGPRHAAEVLSRTI